MTCRRLYRFWFVGLGSAAVLERFIYFIAVQAVRAIVITSPVFFSEFFDRGIFLRHRPATK